MIFENSVFTLSATDLSNHLACDHLTQLNRLLAQDKIKKPTWYDPSLEVLIQRGRDHEAAYVEFLAQKGLSIINLKGKNETATIEAMRKGADVIVQADFSIGSWRGIADILIKVPGKSRFGDWSYEVQDTKLARKTRAATILQLCLYTDLLWRFQETIPEKMYVVKPGVDFPAEAYRFAEFQAYYGLVKKNFEHIMTLDTHRTYPDPVEHCNICRWWQVCDRKRHDDDHLSLVAGIRSLHIVELQRQQIKTLEQFARVEKLEKPERGNVETFVRKQEQARIQLNGREQNSLLHHLLSVEAGRGLNRLPEPGKGDVYFDIEGDAFFPDGGLEYLLGYACREDERTVYHKIWATTHLEEKKAFEEFMAFLTARWARYPQMYVYHFAPYEPSAIKRLARVHATYEKEVDDLLRAERFIDLHAVFKEAMLASVETYSLKELEKFTTYTRKVALHDASSARKSVEIALELNAFNSLAPETIRAVADYNEDDCLATEALHRWLEELRSELAGSGSVFVRPSIKPPDVSEDIQKLEVQSAAIFKALTQTLPADRSAWNEKEKVRWLLAHQIDYFRREDKSAWWEFFRVHELEHEELLDERKAITGLEFVDVRPRQGRERNVTHRYRYPPQEVSVSEGDDLIEVKGEKIGSVRAISPEDNTIDIKKAGAATDIHPQSVHVSERVDPGSLPIALMDIANAVIDEGLDHGWSYPAAKDLLMRRNPKLKDAAGDVRALEGEDDVNGAIRLALNLDGSYLAIQGPPGSGKTFTGASMIVELLKAGKKIGITAVSHKVIRNLAKAATERAKEQRLPIAFVHKLSEKSDSVPHEITEVTRSDQVRSALAEGRVGCGTAWLWSEDDSRAALDYLFVDEAGQMSLSQVLAASRAANNLILLGDPQQLEQPQRGSHPEGSDVAALTYLMDGQPTMPEGRGLFLEFTRRLHPNICEFTSEIFYEGKLKSLPGLENQIVSTAKSFNGAGLFYVPVDHHGNQNQAPEEIEAVTAIVHELLDGGKWTDAKGVTKPITEKDILIVAPFNAQVSALREALPGLDIGTVDKFQGQEAPVVIYSMTCSSAEDAPRGMSFLYSPNRLNVATSRARCTCILVASPRLFEAECRTIEQMRWVNGLCRFAERAG